MRISRPLSCPNCMRSSRSPCGSCISVVNSYTLISVNTTSCKSLTTSHVAVLTATFPFRYHLGHAYIIDVSQSVEHDHPSSFDFLRSDIKNLDDFFKKRSGGEVRTLGIRGTFDFIVNERVTLRGSSDPGPDPMQQTEEELKEVVRNWLDAGVGLQDDSSKLETPSADGATSTSNAATSLAQDDAVFMSSYIPRNLGEVYDPERDIDRINKGQGEDLIYAGITGLNTQANGKGKSGDAPASKEEGQMAEAVADRSRRPSVKSVRFEDDQEESEDGSEDSDDDDSERKPRGFRHEDKEAKKVRTTKWILEYHADSSPAFRNAKRR